MATKNTIYVDLDVTKTGSDALTEPIVLRRGESGITDVVLRLYNNGEAFSTDGFTARFMAYNSDHKLVITPATIAGNEITYTVKSDLTSSAGDVGLAYFELSGEAGSITTGSIPIYILDNVDMTAEEALEYHNVVDELLDELEGYKKKLDDATAEAKTATQSATTAASSANAAADRVDASIRSATEAAGKATTAADGANKAAAAANEAKAQVDEAMETYTTITGSKVEWQVGDSGTDIPAGEWTASVPEAVQGKYLWSRTTYTHNRGADTVAYESAYQGIDGVTTDINGLFWLYNDEAGDLWVVYSDTEDQPPLTLEDSEDGSKNLVYTLEYEE